MPLANIAITRTSHEGAVYQAASHQVRRWTGVSVRFCVNVKAFRATHRENMALHGIQINVRIILQCIDSICKLLYSTEESEEEKCLLIPSLRCRVKTSALRNCSDLGT